MPLPLYKIGTIARLVGLDIATLRNWEQRYGLVVPTRSDGRQRLYSNDDLDRLRLLKTWIESGYSAGEAHRMLRRQLDAIPLPRGSEAARIREEARRVRALVTATHARAAAEQSRAARNLNRIANQATGTYGDRLKRLAVEAEERRRRITVLATESTGRGRQPPTTGDHDFGSNGREPGHSAPDDGDD